MPTLTPSNEVQLEQMIRARIKAILESVPGLGQIHARERFPESDTKDIEISTVPDPITEQARTNVVEIGIPVVSEEEYTGDASTVLTFTYPISVDIEVVDFWDKIGIEFDNSQDLAIGLYMRARKRFKFDRTLGYENVVHNYLQQVSAVVVDIEETKGRLNAIDWSLTVKVTGVLV